METARQTDQWTSPAWDFEPLDDSAARPHLVSASAHAARGAGTRPVLAPLVDRRPVLLGEASRMIYRPRRHHKRKGTYAPDTAFSDDDRLERALRGFAGTCVISSYSPT